MLTEHEIQVLQITGEIRERVRKGEQFRVRDIIAKHGRTLEAFEWQYYLATKETEVLRRGLNKIADLPHDDKEDEDESAACGYPVYMQLSDSDAQNYLCVAVDAAKQALSDMVNVWFDSAGALVMQDTPEGTKTTLEERKEP